MDDSSTFIADPNDYMDEIARNKDADRSGDSTFVFDPNDHVDLWDAFGEWRRRKALSK